MSHIGRMETCLSSRMDVLLVFYGQIELTKVPKLVPKTVGETERDTRKRGVRGVDRRVSY